MTSTCSYLDRLPCFPKPASNEKQKSHLKSNSESGSQTDLHSGSRVAPVGEESVSTRDERIRDSISNEIQNEYQNNRCQVADIHSMNDIGTMPSSHEIVVKNSSSENKNHPDKMSSWRDKEMMQSSTTCRDSRNNNDTHAHKRTNVGKMVPRFDAVSIPNTESGTGC